MMTEADWFGLSHIGTIKSGQEPTAETRGGRSTTPQQQGYWEHWGKLGETGASLLYSSERSQ